MSTTTVEVAACRARQKRMLELMQREQLDLVIVTQIEHVQYLAGPRFAWTFQPAAALTSDGRLTLVAPTRAPEVAAADEIVTYQAQKHSTLRNDQRQASSEVLAGALASRKYKRVGVEYSSCGQHLAAAFGAARFIDIEPALYQMRRIKDPDELALIKKAIAATAKMYARAREMMRPGITELAIFNELQSAAVLELGEMMTGTGNDYQCGSRGGAPRADRAAQAGQLYILDLGPAYRGYFADNCRTIAVTDVGDKQQQAWSHIRRAFDHLETTVKPGKRCDELFREVEEILRESPVGIFDHHLGHGIGLFPHEAPHLNPNWNDVFQEGEVFAAEPGLYAPELRVGMRLENNYLVTKNGVELLSDFPLEL